MEEEHQPSVNDGRGVLQDQVTALLELGEITDCHLMLEGSNATFLAKVIGRDGNFCTAVYKPRIGERPLWDFTSNTLYLREYAAYLVSQVIGWDFIPVTSIREGPHGVGALQQFIPAKLGVNYFSLQERHRDQLWRMAVFDLFANNADRKASHCLLDAQDKLWGIDHGLTFNTDPKLRTVIWDFCGETIPHALQVDMERLLDYLADCRTFTKQLGRLLEDIEVDTLRRRLRTLLERPVFPHLSDFWNIPRPWL